jgi:putative hemolysin
MVWKRILEKLNISVQFDQNKLAKAPIKGPLVFISNHPFGVVDGLILGYLISLIRVDFTLIVNEVLTRERLLREFLLPTDFRETKEALAINIETRKIALDRLLKGEALGIFPAGGVATSIKVYKQKAEDLDCKRFVVKIISKSEARVIPLFFHGQNSRLFQVASHINAYLRPGLLLHEVRNKMGNTIKMEIRKPIPYSELPNDLSKQGLLDYLKLKTFES